MRPEDEMFLTPMTRAQLYGKGVIKTSWSGPSAQTPKLDPRCDEAVRRFLGIGLDAQSGRPYDLSEEPLSDPWFWGF